MKQFLEWLKGLLADTDGIPDEARLMAVLMVLTYIALAIWNVSQEHRPFDYVAFGQGSGWMAAGIGGWFFGRGKGGGGS